MKTPYRILYSNDFTNILSCRSPFHREGENFAPEMLAASVAETAGRGIDVHMLQPGFGWVPLWQSKVLPCRKHWTWLTQNYKENDSCGIMEYLLNDGDIVADFVQHCRKNSLAPFISFRLNDAHHLDRIDTDTAAPINFCEFYRSHPEYRLELRSASWRDRGHNWAIEACRNYKINFIRELCENYDIDGLELDFMRLSYYFRIYETSSAERRAIMVDFIRLIRSILDATSRGQRRSLCVRIPLQLGQHDFMGIDVAAFAAAGVDMFNFSSSFYTVQTGDLERLRALAPQSSMYLEMTQCASIGQGVEKSDGDNFEFTQTSPEEFYSTLDGAYQAGFDGCSLFNFVYYRQHGSKAKKGGFKEPPFEIIKQFREPSFLAAQPGRYFIGSHWEDDSPLPKSMSLFGKYALFTLKQVHKGVSDAELEVHIDIPGAGDWEAWINDHPIFKAQVPESQAEILRWQVPNAFLADGENRLEFRSRDIHPSVIHFIELKTQGESAR